MNTAQLTSVTVVGVYDTFSMTCRPDDQYFVAHGTGHDLQAATLAALQWQVQANNLDSVESLIVLAVLPGLLTDLSPRLSWQTGNGYRSLTPKLEFAICRACGWVGTDAQARKLPPEAWETDPEYDYFPRFCPACAQERNLGEFFFSADREMLHTRAAALEATCLPAAQLEAARLRHLLGAGYELGDFDLESPLGQVYASALTDAPLRPLPPDDGLNQAFVYCQECGWFDTVPAALREDVETWLRFMDPAEPRDLSCYDNLAECPRCSATAVDDDLFVCPRADLEAELAAGELPAHTLKRLRRLLAWHTELLKQRGFAPPVPSGPDTETPADVVGLNTDGGW